MELISRTNGRQPRAANATRSIRHRLRAGARAAAALGLGLQVTACASLQSAKESILGGGPQQGQAGYVKGFAGETVADEPRAALIGKEILSAGGDAADAAVAMALTLGVSLPSRAGLGGGGACVAYTVASSNPAHGVPEAIMFVPPPVRGVAGGDRPAAVPTLARGMFLLHARHGRLPLDGLIEKAQNVAQSGTTVSRAFARDLALVAGPLLADPGARAAFGPGGVPLTEGQRMVQPDLAATLARLRVSGVGDLYEGMLARKLETQSAVAGTPISLADLRAALPVATVPATVTVGDDNVVFPPTSGGIGAAAALRALKTQPNDLQTAFANSLSAAALWRRGGYSSDQVINGALPPPGAVPAYPASTTFGAIDSNGDAVICALTMNNLFGTGRMPPGFGFLTAASPAAVPAPLLAVGLAWNSRKGAFRAAAGGSGQAGAALATAVALANTLRTRQPMPAAVPDPGRANVIACASYLPGSEDACVAVTDPREFGLGAAAR